MNLLNLRRPLAELIFDNKDRYIDIQLRVEEAIAILEGNGTTLAAATELLQDFPDEAWVDTFYEEVVDFINGYIQANAA
jgi:hypothetical protein